MAAPKGNKNACKNSIYSKFIAVVDVEQLDAMSLDNAIEELRLSRARMVTRLQKSDDAKDAQTDMMYDAGARHYLEITMGALERNFGRRVTVKMKFVSLMDAMRAENDRQHVKR